MTETYFHKRQRCVGDFECFNSLLNKQLSIIIKRREPFFVELASFTKLESYPS